jgi:hypothetical protein
MIKPTNWMARIGRPLTASTAFPAIATFVRSRNNMEFVELISRGGNYLVVASNVAWLRTAENGQTLVGMIGSQPLLVTGTIEEVSDTILQAVNRPK